VNGIRAKIAYRSREEPGLSAAEIARHTDVSTSTKEDVLRVAGKYLNPENGVLVVVADQKKTQLKY
jgi:predicted Zn-dependent peptidase